MFVKRIGRKSLWKRRYLCFSLAAALLSGCGSSLPGGAEPSANLEAGVSEPVIIEASSESEKTPGTSVSEPEEASARQEQPEQTKETPAVQTQPGESSAVQTQPGETPAVQPQMKEAPAAQAEAEGKAGNKTIYEGRYFDDQWYDYVDGPAEESPLVYCEIIISNVTDTSFEFVINEEVMATGEVTPVVTAGTAVIEDAGAKAVYKGENLTLMFSFPDGPDTFPQHLEISGSEKLEGNVYMNNTIPGHESG